MKTSQLHRYLWLSWRLLAALAVVAAFGHEQPERAIRQNLLARKGPLRPTDAIELYDLAIDVGETKDVAAANPQIVAKAAAILLREHVPSPEFRFAELDAK
jgi:hypothetical protein